MSCHSHLITDSFSTCIFTNNEMGDSHCAPSRAFSPCNDWFSPHDVQGCMCQWSTQHSHLKDNDLLHATTIYFRPHVRVTRPQCVCCACRESTRHLWEIWTCPQHICSVESLIRLSVRRYQVMCTFYINNFLLLIYYEKNRWTSSSCQTALVCQVSKLGILEFWCNCVERNSIMSQSVGQPITLSARSFDGKLTSAILTNTPCDITYHCHTHSKTQSETMHHLGSNKATGTSAFH